MSDHVSEANLSLDAYWMPFTASRQFKRSPRLVESADGMRFRTPDGRTILDSTSGVWCVNAGHNRRRIVEAIRAQAGKLDFVPPFNVAHRAQFELADRLVGIAPAGLSHVFYTSSGSDAVDTSLKMALAYHRARGQGQRTRLIGRERAHHGANLGGVSVGGVAADRRMFGNLLSEVDHLRQPCDERNLFSKGQPAYGKELADDLERLVAIHDASTIAAVIVEPVGNAGFLLPPQGYLERLRELCNRHGILLIFDEAATGFGRLGAPFAATRFSVTPDLIVLANGLTNGSVPMGAVLATRAIHDAVMVGPDHAVEFNHGYSASGHPLACAAALATLDTYRDEDLMTRGLAMEDEFELAVHGLRDLPGVVDVRNLGLASGIELSPFKGHPGKRAFSVFLRCWEKGLLVRAVGDTIVLSPPLIVQSRHLDQIVDTLSGSIAEATPR